jgi:hypothetical protein
MVHRIERIVLFSLYVPFVSPVKGYVCTCKKMGGAGGGSVDGINGRGGGLLAGRVGGGVRLLINVESRVYDTDPAYEAPKKRVCGGKFRVSSHSAAWSAAEWRSSYRAYLKVVRFA